MASAATRWCRRPGERGGGTGLGHGPLRALEAEPRGVRRRARGVTEEIFDRFPPPEGGRCLDIGCGFGDTTQRLAGLAGPEGFALGTDSSPHFIADARREAAEAGARTSPSRSPMRRPRGGTRVRLCVLAHGDAVLRHAGRGDACDPRCARARRHAPQGVLAAEVREPIWAETEQVVERFLVAPRRVRSRHLRAGTVLDGQPGDMHAAFSRQLGLRRSICIGAILPTTWARTWTRRSRPCSRWAGSRADPPQRRVRRAPAARDHRGARRPLRHLAATRWLGGRRRRPSGSSPRRTPDRSPSPRRTRSGCRRCSAGTRRGTARRARAWPASRCSGRGRGGRARRPSASQVGAMIGSNAGPLRWKPPITACRRSSPVRAARSGGC